MADFGLSGLKTTWLGTGEEKKTKKKKKGIALLGTLPWTAPEVFSDEVSELKAYISNFETGKHV